MAGREIVQCKAEIAEKTILQHEFETVRVEAWATDRRRKGTASQ